MKNILILLAVLILLVGAGCNSSIVKESDKNESCSPKEYTSAFILLVENGTSPSVEQLNNLKKLSKTFSENFKTATNGLLDMNVSDDISIITLTDAMIDKNGKRPFLKLDLISKIFYKENQDIYDFLNIYTLFDGPRAYLYHQTIHNNVASIGVGVQLEDNIQKFGGNRLRGFNYFDNLNRINFEDEESFFRANFALLHETGHQWCCGVGDDFRYDKNNAKLEITSKSHFFHGLESPYKTGTPLRAYPRHQLPDGSYETNYNSNINIPVKYHPFLLYFMGVLPEDEYGTKYKIFDEGQVYREVSVLDIIEVEGERKCVNNYSELNY